MIQINILKIQKNKIIIKKINRMLLKLKKKYVKKYLNKLKMKMICKLN